MKRFFLMSSLCALFLFAFVSLKHRNQFSSSSELQDSPNQERKASPSQSTKDANRSAAAAPVRQLASLPSQPQNMSRSMAEPRPSGMQASKISVPPQANLDQAKHDLAELKTRYPTGKSLEQNNQAFDFLSLRAVPESEYRSEMGDKVYKLMNYILVAKDASNATVLDDSFPVVVRPNGMLAVVTGIFLVKLKDPTAIQHLASKYSMVMKYYDESLNLLYLAAPRSTSLTELFDSLRAEPGVERVTLEIDQDRKRFQ